SSEERDNLQNLVLSLETREEPPSVKWTMSLTVIAALAVFAVSGVAQPTIEPGWDAGSSLKTSGTVDAIEVTGVGGQAAQTLTVHFSDKKTYSSRADVSAG